MGTPELSYLASLDEYHRQAEALFDALRSGDQDAHWTFKWEHPRFRGQTVDAVKAAELNLADAQLVVARQYGFEDWPHLVMFTQALKAAAAVARFEAAVEAVISGDIETLRRMLREYPDLARARSARRHHATLL